jgi:chemotaxis protein MotB
MMSIRSRSWLLAGGLLCGGVLTACVSQSKYDALQAENAQLHQQVSAQSAQNAADQAAIAEGKVHVSRLQGAIKYTIDSDLLFAPGSWELSDAGKRTISKVAVKLAPTQRNKLVVNGYTDNVPIGPDLERKGVSSNQELSEKRAQAVRDFMISRGLNPDLVTAVGHGSSDPVAENETTHGRSQNRRVEVTLGG